MGNSTKRSLMKAAAFQMASSLALATETRTMFGGQESSYIIHYGTFAVLESSQDIAVGGSVEIED